MSHHQGKKRKRKRKPRHKNKKSNTHLEDTYNANEDPQNFEVNEQQQPEDDDIKDENDEFDMNDDFHQTEIMLLQSDNLELKNEIAALKQQLIQRPEPWRPENDRCYIRNEVLEYHSMDKNDIKTRSEIKEKQTKLDQAFDDHVNRLKEWSDFSDKLQNTFKNNEIDDEKKNENEEGVTQLLNLYTNCMKLLHKQQLRTEDIAEYATALSKSKKAVRTIVGEYNINEQPTQQKYKLF